MVVLIMSTKVYHAYACMKNIQRKMFINYVNYDCEKEMFFVNCGNNICDYFFSDLVNNPSKCVNLCGTNVLDEGECIEIGKELVKIYESASNKK